MNVRLPSLLVLSSLLAGCVPIASSQPPVNSGPAVTIEPYTDRAKFEDRLGRAVKVVDFDDVETGSEPVSFAADRYKKDLGIVITGQDGQFAGRTFGFPKDFVPNSKPNSYAPGPQKGGLKGMGGCETYVTFDGGGAANAVAGFGAVFIDADYPGQGPCALIAYDAAGKELAVDKGFSGRSGSQLFRGMVAVKANGQPVAAIAKVKIVSGDGWPANGSAEGVTLDDFVFNSPAKVGTPVVVEPPPPVPADPFPVAGQAPAVSVAKGSDDTIKDFYARHRAFLRNGQSSRACAEVDRLHLRAAQLGAEKALAEFDEAVRAFPSDPDVHFLMALTLQNHRRPEQARAEFEKALRFPVRDAFDHDTRSAIFQELGQLDESLEAINEAIRLMPKCAWFYGNRAGVFESKRLPEAGLKDVNRAIGLDRQNPYLLTLRGNFQLELGRLELAIADYTQSINLNPSPNFKPIFNRGFCYERLGLVQKAIADYSEVIRIAPDHAKSYINRGNLYARLKRYDEALSDLTVGIRRMPKNADTWVNRAGVHNALGDYAHSVADLDDAIRLDPKHVLAHANRGVAYSNMGNEVAAITDLDRAVVLGHEVAIVYLLRSTVYRKFGHFDKAAADMRRYEERKNEEPRKKDAPAPTNRKKK